MILTNSLSKIIILHLLYYLSIFKYLEIQPLAKTWDSHAIDLQEIDDNGTYLIWQLSFSLLDASLLHQGGVKRTGMQLGHYK